MGSLGTGSALTPVRAVQAPILYCFRQMLCGDTFSVVQIGDRARHLEDPIVRPRAQPHASNRDLQRALAGLVERAECAQRRMRDLGIVESALLLNAARGLHPGAHFGAGSSAFFTAQFLVRDRGNFDVKIDAVEQRSADLAQITLDLRRRTPAFTRGVAVESAAAGISDNNYKLSVKPECRLKSDLGIYLSGLSGLNPGARTGVDVKPKIRPSILWQSEIRLRNEIDRQKNYSHRAFHGHRFGWMATVNASDCNGVGEQVMQTRVPSELNPIWVPWLQFFFSLLLYVLQRDSCARDTLVTKYGLRIVVDNTAGDLLANTIHAFLFERDTNALA